MINKTSKIYIAGHSGMVGSAFLRRMVNDGYTNIITSSSKELDLRNQNDVQIFFERYKPDLVIDAAAVVGGIAANMAHPAKFIYDNLIMESNLINSSYKCGVKNFLFLGSSCIMPRLCAQPMKEDYFLDGKVEPTNEGYAIAKIAGIELCDMYKKEYKVNYLSVMPCNLYGENDSFSEEGSHVIPALIRKFYEAKRNNTPKVTLWGTGNAKREFLYVDDMVDASLYLFEMGFKQKFINIGSGFDVSISELASTIAQVVGYNGRIEFDTTKPDGMPQRLLDVTILLKIGWKPKTGLLEGLKRTYSYYLKNKEKIDG